MRHTEKGDETYRERRRDIQRTHMRHTKKEDEAYREGKRDIQRKETGHSVYRNRRRDI